MRECSWRVLVLLLVLDSATGRTINKSTCAGANLQHVGVIAKPHLAYSGRHELNAVHISQQANDW